MTTPRRIPSLLAVAAATTLLTYPARAATISAAPTPAAVDQEADEIQLEVAAAWKLVGRTVTGTVTNGDRDAVSGTAKIVRETSSGTSITLATGGRLRAAAGKRQTLTLTLSAAGRRYFRHRTRASLTLALRETAGTRVGEVGEGIVVRKAHAR